jgi:hypothetical protein
MVKAKRVNSEKTANDKKPKGHKIKRWKKGHSCATNPEIKKHRLAARDRLFKVNNG